MGEITHDGIVKEINDVSIVVGIVNKSACSACHAKGQCMAADMKDKEITIKKADNAVKIGDPVVVVGKTIQGFKALLYGYGLPFVILLLVLIALSALGFNEGVVALSAIGALVPYYFILYLLRDRIKKSFEFEIKSI